MIIYTDAPRTRHEALVRNVKHYFTGIPCSKGHVVMRHITGTCTECQQIANKAWSARNPGEGTKRSLEWQKRNPERAREKSLRSKRKAMGIPEATRPCPKDCENCGCELQFSRTHLDHCHATGKFRGWLCNRCNMGIGQLGDSIEGLQRAIEYLKRSEQASQP